MALYLGEKRLRVQQCKRAAHQVARGRGISGYALEPFHFLAIFPFPAEFRITSEPALMPKPGWDGHAQAILGPFGSGSPDASHTLGEPGSERPTEERPQLRGRDLVIETDFITAPLDSLLGLGGMAKQLRVVLPHGALGTGPFPVLHHGLVFRHVVVVGASQLGVRTVQ